MSHLGHQHVRVGVRPVLRGGLSEEWYSVLLESGYAARAVFQSTVQRALEVGRIATLSS